VPAREKAPVNQRFRPRKCPKHEEILGGNLTPPSPRSRVLVTGGMRDARSNEKTDVSRRRETHRNLTSSSSREHPLTSHEGKVFASSGPIGEDRHRLRTCSWICIPARHDNFYPHACGVKRQRAALSFRA
jgi:hypothetical protein